MPHQHLNPDTLYKALNNVYTQIVTSGGTRQWHIAGMVPLNKHREIVGEGDLAAQTAQVMRNIGLALEAVGATPAHIVRINIYTTDVKRYLAEGGPCVRSFFGDTPPASTLIGVAALADERYLVEVEATAVGD